jgi:dipeptidyl aminopeptidase/acylaminoacyl peptidase
VTRTLRGTATALAAAGAAAAVFLAPSATAAEAPAVRPLEIADAVLASDFHTQGRPAFSPDGAAVAYTVCDPRRKKPSPLDKEGSFATKGSAYLSMGCDVWIAPLDGSAARNVTAARGNNWGPSWSPDGRLLAYYSDRNAKPQLWVYDGKTRRSRAVCDAPTRTILGFTVALWTPDSRRVVVRLRPEGMTDAELESAAPPPTGEDAEKEPGSTVVVYRSRPRAADGKETPPEGALPRLLVDLSVVDVATGEIRRIAPRASALGAFLSPDGSRLAYLVYRRRKNPNSVGAECDLLLFDFASGATRTLVAGVEQGFGTAVSWSPDGTRLAYFSGPGYRAADCYVVAVADGSPRKVDGAKDGFLSDFLAPLWDAAGKSLYLVGGNRVWRADADAAKAVALSPDLGEKVFEILQTTRGDRIWSPDGTFLYVSRRDERTKKAVVTKVALASGRAETILEEPKAIGRVFDTPLVAPDGKRVVYLSESAGESADLWIAGVDFREPRRLTRINPQLDAYRFGESRLLDFVNVDGKALHAALLLPAGYREGTRCPTLVFVYPQDWGSETVYRFGLGGFPAYNLQMLATRGYAVLQPDAPVGKGTILPDLLKSVMPAIDRAAQLGVVDPERLAVTGQSGGGYATLAIVTQTTRFKAAIMNAGFGDLTAFYGSMSVDTGEGNWIPWLETLTGGMGAGPWDAAQTYVQNSPVYYLNRVETPMIIQAGSADSAIVPYSDEVYVGLKRLGKDVTYLRYGGESHVLAAQSNLVDYWKRVIRFLDERVKGAGTRAEGATP